MRAGAQASDPFDRYWVRSQATTNAARVLTERRKAQLTTARLARDREDCRYLLDVLGLLPGQDPGTLDALVQPPFVS